MSRLVDLVAITLGGWIGWWLGEHVGLMSAVTLSAVGSGVGLYASRWLLGEYFDS